MSEYRGTAIRDIDAKWIMRGILVDVICGTRDVSSTDDRTPVYAGRECNGSMHALWRIRDRVVTPGHDRKIHNDTLRIARDAYDGITYGVAMDTRYAVNAVLRWLMAHDTSAWELWSSCLVTDWPDDDDIAPNAGSAL